MREERECLAGETLRDERECLTRESVVACAAPRGRRRSKKSAPGTRFARKKKRLDAVARKALAASAGAGPREGC